MEYKNIFADELHIGKGAIIHESAVIRGLKGNAKKIYIGDHAYIGADTQIICDDFSIGDYSKLHHHSNVHGYKPCHIGHNAWIGQYCIIDSIGGTTIGNNCGIGAHSQLWSHIKFGDTLEGCRFQSEKPLSIGADVWFVGHCIVGPLTAEDKSMALVGSVITHDMKYNEIYAGSPAVSISEKAGYQFNEVPLETKLAKMKEYLKASNIDSKYIHIISDQGEVKMDNEISYFNVANRSYTKKGSEAEIAFMKFLLPDKAKFVPFTF